MRTILWSGASASSTHRRVFPSISLGTLMILETTDTLARSLMEDAVSLHPSFASKVGVVTYNLVGVSLSAHAASDKAAAAVNPNIVPFIFSHTSRILVLNFLMYPKTIMRTSALPGLWECRASLKCFLLSFFQHRQYPYPLIPRLALRRLQQRLRSPLDLFLLP